MGAWFMLTDPEGELETHPDGVVMRSADHKCPSYVFGADPTKVEMLIDINKFRGLQHLLTEMVPIEGEDDVIVGFMTMAEAEDPHYIAQAKAAIAEAEAEAEEAANATEETEEGTGSIEAAEADAESNASDETPETGAPEPEKDGKEAEFDPEVEIIAMLDKGEPLSKKSLRELLPTEMAEQADDIYDKFVAEHGDELKKFGHNLFLKDHHTE